MRPSAGSERGNGLEVEETREDKRQKAQANVLAVGGVEACNNPANQARRIRDLKLFYCFA